LFDIVRLILELTFGQERRRQGRGAAARRKGRSRRFLLQREDLLYEMRRRFRC
jgi:hypothetical protein